MHYVLTSYQNGHYTKVYTVNNNYFDSLTSLTIAYQQIPLVHYKLEYRLYYEHSVIL